MNTWVIGNAPIGYCQDNKEITSTNPTDSAKPEQSLTFFMKARIMAGQVDLVQNALGILDFKWLPKEEIRLLVDPTYWRNVVNMIASR
jgi:large subunit ribosomal protein L46